MIIGSKDSEENKIRFRASNRIFQNSTCVFVEYNDAIQIPWFTFLSFFRKNEKVDDVFRTDEIRHLSIQALMTYYFNRPFKNPLVGLLKDNSVIELEKLDELLESQVNSTEIFFNPNIDSFLVPIIGNLLANGLVKDVVIYYPTDNEFVRKDINHKFNGRAKFVYGDLSEVISKLPDDTTYFFSDVMNVLTLEETGKINFSAIMLPSTYRYNYVDDNKEKFLVDMEYLSEKYVFKWATYEIAWFLYIEKHHHNKNNCWKETLKHG